MKKNKLKLYYVTTSDGGKGFIYHKKKKQAIAHAMNMWGCSEDSVGVGSRVKPKEAGQLIAPEEVVKEHSKEISRLLNKMQPA